MAAIITTQPARPLSLTDEATLRSMAEAWITSNGLPRMALLEAAIRRSDHAGDPFAENPFRHMLLVVAAEHGASPYAPETPARS